MTYGGFDRRIVFDWIPVPKREDKRRNNDRSLALRFVLIHSSSSSRIYTCLFNSENECWLLACV